MGFCLQKKKRGFLSKAVSLFLAAVFFALILLPGCTLVHVPVTEISFKTDSLTMRVGDELRIDSELVDIKPILASNKGFKLKSSDLSVLRPNFLKVIEAVSVGEAILTVTSEDNPECYAELPVTVEHAIPEDIRIISEGKLYQYLDEGDGIKAVSFTVDFPGLEDKPEAVDSLAKIEWFTDGKRIPYIDEISGIEEEWWPIDRALPFQPPREQGSFVILAAAHFPDGDGGWTVRSASTSVNIYKRFRIDPFTYTGDLEQNDGAYKTVSFAVDYDGAVEGNPAPAIVWSCNDVPAAGFDGSASFLFRPDKAGRYKIRLTVNDESVATFEGGEYTEIIARGSSVPRNISFDFDQFYPAIVLSWDTVKEDPEAVSYAVRIETAAGHLIADGQACPQNFYTQKKIDAPGRFGVDLSDMIGYGNPFNIFNGSFKVSVKSLGGDIYTPSAYTLPLITPLVPIAAQPFLQKTYYEGYRNYYASDPAELCDIYTYTALTRDRQYRGTDSSVPSATFTVYIGYPYPETMKEMLENSFARRYLTGYFTFTFTQPGPITTITVSYHTDGLPSISTPSGRPLDRPTYNSSVPHVNFDEPAEERSLPITGRRLSPVTVATTEQLYTAAEEGFYPVPDQSLNTPEADKTRAVYMEAETVLKNIVTDEMTDIDKVHAIYDFVMWRTVYDEYATRYLDTADAVRDRAYYLDGVFTGSNLAVCDGLAKAVSLLCNMEGIPALRIAGKAWTGSRWEGHAWNKVKVNNAWYIVDATWGKKLIHDFNMFGSSARDVAGHRYLFRTDSELILTHREDSPNNYPLTAREPFGFYEKAMAYYPEGVRDEKKPVDFFMDSVEFLDEAHILADYLVHQIPETDNDPYTYFVGSAIEKNKTQVAFISFDIRIHTVHQGRYQNIAGSPITTALKARGLLFNADFFIHSDISNGEMYQRIFLSVNPSGTVAR